MEKTMTMRDWRITVAMAALFAATHSMTIGAESVEDVTKKIGDAWKKFKTLSYDMETVTVVSSPSFSVTTTSSGNCEMLRDSVKFKMRMVTKILTDTIRNGTTTKLAQTCTLISDGEFAHTLTDTQGVVRAIKSKADAYTDSAGGAGFIDGLKETSAVTVLPDADFHGMAVFVLEAKERAKESAPATRYYVSKEMGIVVHFSIRSPENNETVTLNITNIKIDPVVAADRFVFTAPEGVKVLDMSKE